MRELMDRFNQWKRRFNKDHEDIKMDLPEPLHNLNLDTRVVGGEIRITKSVITYLFFHNLLMLNSGDMKSFFEPCVTSIIELIEGQIGQVEGSLGRRVRV